MRKALFSTLIVFATTCALASHSSADVPISPVTLSGQPAPGVAGNNFRDFDEPRIDETGLVAFSAYLDGSVKSGIWTKSASELALLVRSSAPAPGAPAGSVFKDSAETFHLTRVAGGIVTFNARMDGPGITPDSNDGIWTNPTGSVSLIAREGAQAPGFPPGTLFFGLNAFRVAEGARFSFPADIFTDPATPALYIGQGTQPRLLAAYGQPAPGAEPGAVFRGFDRAASFDAAGAVAFNASIDGGASGPGGGIWTGQPDALKFPVRTGGQAAGLPAGVTYGGFTLRTRLVSDGRLAFGSRVRGPGFDEFNNDFIYFGAPTSPTPIVRELTQAAGQPPGVVYDEFRDFAVGDRGDVVFEASIFTQGVPNSSRRGLWQYRDGTTTAIAVENQPAPGAPGLKWIDFAYVSLNDAGQVAFHARLADINTGALRGTGIWATDPAGQLMLVARVGGQIEVAPGDIRTVQTFVAPFPPLAPNDGSRIAEEYFNSAGQLAFRAFFQDGSSGVFVATVPEPASLVSFVFLGILSRRIRAASANH